MFYYVNCILFFIYLFSSLTNQLQRLVFFANKLGSKIFIFLQAEFQDLPKQVEKPKQVERSENCIALLFLYNA